MNFNRNSSMTKFTEATIITALMTIFILVGIYFIPVVSILYPIPFIVLGIRQGIKYSSISIVASSLLIGILVEPLTGFFIFIAFAPLSIALAYMIKTKKSSYKTSIVTIFVTLISFIIVINFIDKITGVTFINQIDQFLSNTLKSQVNILKDMGLSNYEIYKTQNLLENTFDYMILIVPSMVIIFSAFTAYLNYLISSLVLKKMRYRDFYIPRFSYFRLPNDIILGVIIIFGGAFLLRFLKIFYYETIFINIIVLASFVFFLEGFSVIDFYLNKSKINKVAKVIILIFLIISVPLSVIISIIGFLDIIFDFRKIKKRVK